jgi:cellulose biosynthesis protein BcsQ
MAECEQLGRFDVAISVCGFGIGPRLVAGLATAKAVVMPLSDWSMGTQLKSLLDCLDLGNVARGGPPVDMVVPMASGRADRALARLVKELDGVRVFQKVIRNRNVVVESLVAGMPLAEYYPCAGVTKNVYELVVALLMGSSQGTPHLSLVDRLAVPFGVKHRGYRYRMDFKRSHAENIASAVREIL